MNTSNQTHSWYLRRCRGPSAYTLIEAMVSLVVMSTIMGATVSTMVLASRAVGGGTSGGLAKIAESKDVVEQIASELSLALAFTVRSDTVVAFTVPDRNDDGQPESIRYEWSGVAGDPLTRQYNGGTQATIADNVHYFSLSYLLKTVPASGWEPLQESEEVILHYHDDAPGGTFQEHAITSTQWSAQYFKPEMPTNAETWKITRVQFRAKTSAAADGAFTIQIRTVDAQSKPTTTVLAETTVNESSLGSTFDWVSVDIGPLEDLDVGVGYSLVVKYASGDGEVATVEFEQDGAPMTPRNNWMITTDAGATWSDRENVKDMRFFVHGTYTTQGEPQWP